MGPFNVYLSGVTGIIKLRGLILKGQTVGIKMKSARKIFILKLRKNFACKEDTIMNATEIHSE